MAVTAAVALALTGCTSPPANADSVFDQVEAPFAGGVQEALAGVLAEAVRLSGSSGGIAGAWAPWAGEWEAATGTTEFGEAAPAMTVDDGFRATTLTTAITCTVLLRLVDEGTVALDDTASSLLRGMPNLGEATLGQLCQGTSGLADYYGQLRSTFLTNPERSWSAMELVSDTLAVGRVGAPGETWSYSHGGVILLARALTERTGKDWDQLAEQYVLDPLGLGETRLPDSDELEPDGVIGGSATPLAPDGSVDCSVQYDESSQSSSIGGAAAGAITTLDEARTLTQAFASSLLLSERSGRSQWTPVSMGASTPSWQQYGLGAAQYGPMRGTAGEVPGALTAAFTDPESGLTVVVALNNSTSGSDFVREVAFALASIASKADAAPGRDRAIVDLPWSFEQSTQHMNELARCPIAPPAEG